MLLAALLLLAVGYPMFRTESFRYQEALHECWKRHTANANLLQTELCRNPHNRLQYGNAGTVNCDQAEKELLLSPNQCAFKQWWKDTELIHFYHRVAGSYWTLLGIFLPIVLFFMYLYSKQLRERQSEEMFYEKQGKFLQHFLPQRRERPQVEHVDDDYDTGPMLEFTHKKLKKKAEMNRKSLVVFYF